MSSEKEVCRCFMWDFMIICVINVIGSCTILGKKGQELYFLRKYRGSKVNPSRENTIKVTTPPDTPLGKENHKISSDYSKNSLAHI